MSLDDPPSNQSSTEPPSISSAPLAPVIVVVSATPSTYIRAVTANDLVGIVLTVDCILAAFLVGGHTVFRATNTDRVGWRADRYVFRIELADLTTDDHERALHQAE